MRSLFIFSAFTVLLFCACKKSGTTTPTNPYHYVGFTDTVGQKIQLDSFPLKAGNMWVYDNGDTIRAVADTIINGNHAMKMERTNSTLSETYFAENLADGLHLVTGYHNDLGILPFDVFSATDSLSTFAPPVFLAKYPADTGSSNKWTSYKSGTRYWSEYATVTTCAGTFNCVRLTTENGLMEYYSDKGLIRVVAIPVYASFRGTATADGASLVYVNF